MNFGAPFSRIAVTLYTWSWSTVTPEVTISLFQWDETYEKVLLLPALIFQRSIMTAPITSPLMNSLPGNM